MSRTTANEGQTHGVLEFSTRFESLTAEHPGELVFPGRCTTPDVLTEVDELRIDLITRPSSAMEPWLHAA